MVTFTFIIFSIIERKRVSEENHVNLSAKLNFSAKGVPVVVKIELSLSDFIRLSVYFYSSGGAGARDLKS